MAKILCVGIATVDIINSVDGFPEEDAEVRAVAQRICRGGNASNSAVVLSQLGHACDWCGTLVEESDGRRILADLEHHGVGHRYSKLLPQGKVPTSYITLNQDNGSRTIVHYRDLPELDAEHLKRLPLETFDWIHFEGRNIDETRQMMQHCSALAKAPLISLEVEKPRETIDTLFAYADLLLFSRVYARHQGYDSGEAFVTAMHRTLPDKRLVCAWGSNGAYAIDNSGELLHQQAIDIGRPVDTVGAGDVFNAGIISALSLGQPLPQALKAANTLAGRKCQQFGFDKLLQETKQ